VLLWIDLLDYMDRVVNALSGQATEADRLQHRVLYTAAKVLAGARVSARGGLEKCLSSSLDDLM
jgi:hypothetical protein